MCLKFTATQTYSFINTLRERIAACDLFSVQAKISRTLQLPPLEFSPHALANRPTEGSGWYRPTLGTYRNLAQSRPKLLNPPMLVTHFHSRVDNLTGSSVNKFQLSFKNILFLRIRRERFFSFVLNILELRFFKYKNLLSAFP